MSSRARSSTSASTTNDLAIDQLDPDGPDGGPQVQQHITPSASASTSRGTSRAGTAAAAATAAGEEAEGTPSKGTKKKSQRPSWSCTECTRRKIRCDRVVPGCNQCIKRGKVHLCRLDQDLDLGFGGPPPNLTPSASTSAASYNPHASPTQPAQQPRLATAAEYDAIARSVHVVRQRLCHLERAMRAFVAQPGLVDENGQPMFGIDLNLLAATASMPTEQPSTGGGGGGASNGPGSRLPEPSRHDSFSSSAGEYEPKAGYRIEGMGGSQVNTYPLPHSHDRVRELEERERRMTESDGEVEAAVTLEYLALGRDRKEDHFHRAELRRPEEDDEDPTSPALGANTSLPESSILPGSTSAVPADPGPPNPPITTTPAQTPLDSLPTPELSDYIISFSLERVCWQHTAVHVGQFRAEHAEFQSWGDKRGQLVNQAWIALYFALLCVGVKHMDDEEARRGGISREDRARLPRVYFDSAIASLHRANFLSKHSIYTVQTIVVMIITCQEVGGSDLIATLLACGIRIAQHLNIHRFASDQEWESRRRANGIDPKSQEGIKGLIQRELRKRLWYTLVIEDWLCIPFRRSYTIFPTHFTTPLPLNCHDADLSAGNLVQRSHDEPTIASKIIATFEVAKCIRRFFEHVNSAAVQGDSASYELCLEADAEIRKIIQDGPKYLKVEDPNSEEWIKYLRHYFVISISHKLLMCHRVFLGRSFRDPRFAYSRRAAIEAARSVIQEIARGSETRYQHLWTLPFHTIAASTTIILDIFQSSSADPDTPNKRREVEIALEQLRKLSDEGSQIATRGVQLLSTLLAEEAKHRRPTTTTTTATTTTIGESRKRRASGSAPGEAERFVANRGLLSSSNNPSSTFPYFAPTLPPTSSSSSGVPHGVVQGASSNNGVHHHHHESPADSHFSDGLNQDAFDAILQGFNGYGTGASGALIDANGVDEGGGGDAATAEFWRNFDSTFDPGALEMLGGGMADVGIGFGFGTGVSGGGGTGVEGEGVGTPAAASAQVGRGPGGTSSSALGFTTPW